MNQADKARQFRALHEAPGAFVKTKRQSLARVNHYIFQRLIGRSGAHGRFVPTLVSTVIEDETEIVNFTIVFPRFECQRIGRCQLQPLGIARLLVKDPHHPRQKTVAPMRPRGFLMTPPTAVGI